MNIADEEQTSARAKKLDSERDLELADLRDILRIPAGRRVLGRILEKTGDGTTVWEASARIHYNAALHDYAIWLKKEWTDADIVSFLQHLKEKIVKEKTNV